MCADGWIAWSAVRNSSSMPPVDDTMIDPIEPFAWPVPLDVGLRASVWSSAWQELGPCAAEDLRAELEAAWGEGHRHYHDVRHLGECLALFEQWKAAARHPAEVALALWFHDAIYEPRVGDNETRSAAWAARCLSAAGVESDVAQRVYDLVMATRHDAPVADGDAALLVDIDLAILGSPPDRFDDYDRDVRREYHWVPGLQYRRKRSQVLQSFVERSAIYHTRAAMHGLERQARRNLQGALEGLRR
jgi:predicted metal-dependent HD superfamily phosphohydrolase